MATTREDDPVTTRPIEKTVEIPVPREEAFERFTADMAAWWPLATHSVGRSRTETVVFEEKEGGRIYERQKDGEEQVWGTVEIWEPHERLRFSWHPGEREDTAQTVEVRFEEGDEGTRVKLTHDGWDRLAERAPAAREEYDSGWEPVLGQYKTLT